MENRERNPQNRITKYHTLPWNEITSRMTSIHPSKNSYVSVAKPHQWTKSITSPNNFKYEDWLTHTIDSLLKRLDNIKNQKSAQNNVPCTNSASQLHESTQITPEQRNEPTISNSRSALPLPTQLVESAVSNDENEMESISASTKRGHHDSSDEEPNSAVNKSLPLVPQPIGGMALPCRQGQEGEIYQRSPLSTLTLQNQEDRGLLWEIGL